MLAPMVAANVLFLCIITRNKVVPVITDISQLLSSLVVCQSVIVGLLRPRGHGFNVTSKGISTHDKVIHWNLIWPLLAIALATLTAMFAHLSRHTELNGSSGYGLNVIWSILNAFILLAAAAACVEIPKRRQHERFFGNISSEILLE